MTSQDKLVVGVSIGFVSLIVVGLGVLNFMGEKPTAGAPASDTAAAEISLPRIETISHGDEVDLQSYLRPDVTTVVEFTADW